MKHKKENNYIFEFWWIASMVGKLAESLLINSHQFNYTPPEDIDLQIEQIISKLKEFQKKYKKQYNQTDFYLVR